MADLARAPYIAPLLRRSYPVSRFVGYRHNLTQLGPLARQEFDNPRDAIKARLWAVLRLFFGTVLSLVLLALLARTNTFRAYNTPVVRLPLPCHTRSCSHAYVGDRLVRDRSRAAVSSADVAVLPASSRLVRQHDGRGHRHRLLQGLLAVRLVLLWQPVGHRLVRLALARLSQCVLTDDAGRCTGLPRHS